MLSGWCLRELVLAFQRAHQGVLNHVVGQWTVASGQVRAMARSSGSSTTRSSLNTTMLLPANCLGRSVLRADRLASPACPGASNRVQAVNPSRYVPWRGAYGHGGDRDGRNLVRRQRSAACSSLNEIVALFTYQ
jgi:hypothetical protein